MNFEPSVYEHAAFLIDRSAWEVSRDADLMFMAHTAAYEMYRHNPVVMGIDIYNLEAEAYGAHVEQLDGEVLPAISERLLQTTADIPHLESFNPLTAGRIPQTLDAAKRLHSCHPKANIRFPVSGPFSIASNLVGLEPLLMETMTKPDTVRQAMEWLVNGQIELCQAIAAQNLHITLFESAATPPLLSPQSFKHMLFPSLVKLVQRASYLSNERIACIIGGDTYPIMDTILETEPGYIICPVETEQARFMERMKQFPDVTVRINMQPSVFRGDIRAAVEEADRVFDIANERVNVCIGSSALPFDANPEIVLRVKEYIQNRVNEQSRSVDQ